MKLNTAFTKAFQDILISFSKSVINKTIEQTTLIWLGYQRGYIVKIMFESVTNLLKPIFLVNYSPKLSFIVKFKGYLQGFPVTSIFLCKYSSWYPG